MKPLALTLVGLFVVGLACGECVVIMQPGRPSHRNVQLKVLRDGKPRQNVTLTVVWQVDNKQARPTITTDAHGMAKLEDLAPGDYCIEANAEPRLADTLCLNVSKSADAKPSEFRMVLSPVPPPPPTLEEQVQEAEKQPIELRGQVFEGVVNDVAGAGIPRAEIAVYRHGSVGKADPVKRTADENGRFSAQLSPGNYTAVFQSQGFKLRFIGLEIGPKMPKQDMPVTLQIRNDVC